MYLLDKIILRKGTAYQAIWVYLNLQKMHFFVNAFINFNNFNNKSEDKFSIDHYSII